MYTKQLLICPSCRSCNYEKIGPIPQKSIFAGKELDKVIKQYFYKCNYCNIFFKHPVLPKNETDSLYKQVSMENWQYSLHDRKDWQIAIKVIDELSSGQGSILDIGCWNGEFLNNIRDNWDLFGIEINEEASKIARRRGIDMLSKDIEHIKQLPVKFDVITLFDLIEHVYNPLELLCGLYSKLKKGGVIILSSGNTDALTWKISGSQYWYCSLPEHMVFINKAWCEFVEKQLALKLFFVERFSHGKENSICQKSFESLKNIAYLSMPSLFEWGRKLKHSGVNRTREGLNYAPTWKSSKDHIVIAFKKVENCKIDR